MHCVLTERSLPLLQEEVVSIELNKALLSRFAQNGSRTEYRDDEGLSLGKIQSLSLFQSPELENVINFLTEAELTRLHSALLDYGDSIINISEVQKCVSSLSSLNLEHSKIIGLVREMITNREEVIERIGHRILHLSQKFSFSSEEKFQVIHSPEFFRKLEFTNLTVPFCEKVAKALEQVRVNQFGNRSLSFLDIGAWNGRLGLSLQNYFSCNIACEPNPTKFLRLQERYAMAEKKSDKEFKALPLRAQDLPSDPYISSKTFDLIVLSHILYFIKYEEDEQILSWAYSRLNPGGKIVVLLNDQIQEQGSRAQMRHKIVGKDFNPNPNRYTDYLKRLTTDVEVYRPGLIFTARDQQGRLALRDIIRYHLPGMARHKSGAIDDYIERSLRRSNGNQTYLSRLTVIAATKSLDAEAPLTYIFPSFESKSDEVEVVQTDNGFSKLTQVTMNAMVERQLKLFPLDSPLLLRKRANRVIKELQAVGIKESYRRFDLEIAKSFWSNDQLANCIPKQYQHIPAVYLANKGILNVLCVLSAKNEIFPFLFLNCVIRGRPPSLIADELGISTKFIEYTFAQLMKVIGANGSKSKFCGEINRLFTTEETAFVDVLVNDPARLIASTEINTTTESISYLNFRSISSSQTTETELLKKQPNLIMATHSNHDLDIVMADSMKEIENMDNGNILHSLAARSQMIPNLEKIDGSYASFYQQIREIPVLNSEEEKLLTTALRNLYVDFRSELFRIPLVILKIAKRLVEVANNHDVRAITEILEKKFLEDDGQERLQWLRYNVARCFPGCDIEKELVMGIANLTTKETRDLIPRVEEFLLTLDVHPTLVYQTFEEIRQQYLTGLSSKKSLPPEENILPRFTVSEFQPLLHQLSAIKTRIQIFEQAMRYYNLRLINFVLKKYESTGQAKIDLFNEGLVGLTRAVIEFNPDMGLKFSSYAVHWIKGIIRRSIQNNSKIIRIPVHLQEAARRVNRLLQNFPQYKTDPQKITDLTEVSIESVKIILDMPQANIPNNQDAQAENLNTLGELFIDHLEDKGADLIGLREEINKKLLPLWKSLGRKKRAVINYYYGLGLDPKRDYDLSTLGYDSASYGKELTLEEVGEKLGLTRGRTQQIINGQFLFKLTDWRPTRTRYTTTKKSFFITN